MEFCNNIEACMLNTTVLQWQESWRKWKGDGGKNIKQRFCFFVFVGGMEAEVT